VSHVDGSYIMKTADDGSYSLDFDAWGLTGDGTATITLMRMVSSSVTVNEQDMDITSLVYQNIYANLSSKEVLDNPPAVGDTCDDVADPVGSGEYSFGGQVTTDWNDDVNITCILDGAEESYGSIGADGWMTVELNTNETLVASYSLGMADGVLYLTDSCSIDPDCLALSDVGGVVTETIQYTNTGDPMTYYLGLDLWEPPDGSAPTSLPQDYLLDIWIGELTGAPMVDTCDEAMAADPLVAGSYYHGGDFGTEYNNDIDTEGEWTGYDHPGPDSLIPVTLENGQKITATFAFDENDAVLYLIPDCSGTAGVEAAAGADATLNGQSESLSYTNTTGAAETLYLGLDLWENAEAPHVPNDGYSLSIVIQ